jgi:hypothetical protein
MADDKFREGDPDNPRKKKAPLPDDDDRPRKKRRADDEEEEPGKKKKAVAKDEDENEDDDEDDVPDRGRSALSAFLPVGGSIFALLSLWIGLFSALLGGVALASALDMITIWRIGKIPPLAGCFVPMLWPVALASGGLSFVTHKHKASYGSIAGNMRAVIGILLSLGALVLHGVLVFRFFTIK